MPIPLQTDRPRRGDPSRHLPGRSAPSSPSLAEPATAPRRRRDLVGWIALGLVVTTVLALLARVSVDPRGPDATTAPNRPRTSPANTVAPARLTTTERVPRLPAHQEPNTAVTMSSNPVQPTDPVTVTAAPAGAATTERAQQLPADEEPGTAGSAPGIPTRSTIPTTTSSVSGTSGLSSSAGATSDSVGVAGASPQTTDLSGVLRYPDDIATSMPFASPSGLASVRASWRGGEALALTLGCGSAVTNGAGTHGVSLVVAGPPGSCAVSIALGPGQRGSVAYTLDVQTPAADTAAGTTR
jgi:hypothetical protein